MKTALWIVPLALVFGSLSSAQTTTVQPLPPISFQVTPPTYNFGMVGLSLGQNMRVVVTNVGTAPPLASPLATPACGVNVKFYDQKGTMVGQGHIDSLAAGVSFAVEQLGPAGSGRLEYRASIQPVVPTATTGTVPVTMMVCDLISTLQVYDTVGGKTDLLLTGNPLVMGWIYPVPLAAARSAN